MQHKMAIGIMLMIFSMIGIICLNETENKSKENKPVQVQNKPVTGSEETKIPGVKPAVDIKNPEIKTPVIAEKKEMKLSATDQIIIPKSSAEVYEDYLEGFVVGKKNLGDTADSSLDETHFYLYVKTASGNVKMYRTTEAKFNMVNNGDRILYRKSKDGKMLKVSDEKWK